MSPCPSFGRCWPRFPSASLAGGWPTAATGSDAEILMANQESDEDSCPERPGGAEGPHFHSLEGIYPEEHHDQGSLLLSGKAGCPAERSDKGILFHQSRVSSHGYCFTLPRDFAASSFHSRSFFHAESSHRNSPQSFAPYPP